ncbi:Fe(3+)-hydroxamate ABC transporter permease FhuB [Ensifer adhaerens]|uniref:Fe(3+)-hydroxamate ABC transporter permease FhuB n=1 Tax=Ensifer adhaerens TaxID=106592 RepID=UPI0009901B55|nr:Fe(3+)-hydroxamate ABC transporter permease FhuB [Ensifer adhaerens]
MSSLVAIREPFRLTILLLGAVAGALTLRDALGMLPAEDWFALLWKEPVTPTELLARFAFAPQIAMALLSGAALALCGVLLQQAMRNPLAEPTTLGTSAGSALALTAATIFAPSWLEHGRELIALGGGALATAAVMLIAARGRYSASAIILGGVVVAMTAGAATGMLLALFTDYLAEIFVWQSGSLVQNGDSVALALAARLAVTTLLILVFLRPLGLLSLPDSSMASLGVRPWLVRLMTVLLGVALAASVAAAVGVIAFVGLAAPAFARLTGARTFGRLLMHSTLLGALGLLLVDRLSAALFDGFLPIGAMTAVIGAPVLIMLIRALPPDRPDQTVGWVSGRDASRLNLPLLALIFILAVGASLAIGRSQHGGLSVTPVELHYLIEFRGARVLASAAAGALLAIAGGILQRMTSNPLAAPEALGVSGGAIMAVLLVIVSTQAVDPVLLSIGAAAGALAVSAALGAALVRGRARPERTLLGGLAVTMMATGWASVFLASGDPRTIWAMSWLSGSTYRVTEEQALFSAGATVLALAIVPLLRRPMTLLPLGIETAAGLGMRVPRAWSVSFLVAASCTAVATMVVGPLSFIGLSAPHVARLLGFRHATQQLWAAASVGATIMVLADWLGRITIYPWEIPAGIIAAVVGGLHLGLLLCKGRRSV